MLIKYSVGVDVDSKKLVAAICSINTELEVKIVASRKFDNSSSGCRSLEKWVGGKIKNKELPLVYCMEATGVYHEGLAYYLFEKNKDVAVVLPNYSKRYIESLGLKSKNDSIDARGLATMAAQQKLKLWSAPAKFYIALRSMTRQKQALEETKTQIANQLHAYEKAKLGAPLVKKQLKSTLKHFEKQIKAVEKAIEQHIGSDEQIAKKVEQICLIKGIGMITVATVLAETFGFELFYNTKQLVSYAGYDVVENQSGKREGKTKISKKGNSRIRRCLHMPAFSVVKYEPHFQNLFHRTFERHYIKMKSYVAVQKKILTTIYALWKKDEPFIQDYNYPSSNMKDKIQSETKEKSAQKNSLAVNETTLGNQQNDLSFCNSYL